MGDLDGRVVLITGGGSGIGAGCARRLVAESGHVVVADIDAAAAARMAAEIGDAATAMTVDVRDPDAVDELIGAVHETHGGLDVAVNVAGIAGPTASPVDFPVDGWRHVLDVNLSGVFYCMRAELAVMVRAGRGSIINMASIYGTVGTPMNMGYVAAKHGVVGITGAAALAYAQQGIRVNAVAPAVIDTPIVLQAPPDIVAQVVALHPMGRVGQIGELQKPPPFSRPTARRFVLAASTPSTAATPPVDHGRGPKSVARGFPAAMRATCGFPEMSSSTDELSAPTES